MDNYTSEPTDLVQQWIEQCVIDLSLCPFASAPYRAGRVRIAVCQSGSEIEYLQMLDTELGRLAADISVETTLVVAQRALSDFFDFNDFLSHAEALLETVDRESKLQIASFHPQYQFAGVAPSDVGNYTNRAPFPIIQWLRADTVAQAVQATDTLAIPDNNIETLKSISSSRLAALFPWCVENNS